MPFAALSENIVCVDDPRSRYYNRLVDQSKVENRDWKHAERMFGIDLYRSGVVVEHNIPSKPDAGSCIFLHVWKNSKTSTSGCTAMAEAKLLQIIRWLDPAKHPLLVQLPRPVYETLRAKWNLPSGATF
jgi:L,D-peptidoglycan transpeptidase YkuD (ErfK/YbiS/YcfS/YnhG family)